MAILPLRAGSQGIRQKNLRLLDGVPLYRHSLDQALRTVGNCVVTTDIKEVLAEDLPDICIKVKRPASLATSETPMAPVLVHLFSEIEKQQPLPETAILLQATSPLRRDQDIHAALKLYQEGQHDLVLTVTRADSGILKYGFVENGMYKPVSSSRHCFANRQSLPSVFRPNGAVYVFSPRLFLETGDFPSERIGAVEMPEEYAMDIDEEADLKAAEETLQFKTAAGA